MAFIVEDGTGLPDANSYLSVADADAYFADRGEEAWTGDAATKQAALVRATDYLTREFANRWRGDALVALQALAWPRTGISTESGAAVPEMPDAIRHATAELALHAIQGADLMPERIRGGQIVRERVDGLEISYASGAPAATHYPAVDGLIRVLLRPRTTDLVRG